MRYYHYVSDSKVDMLFQQIPQGHLKGLSGEIGFDVLFLKAKVQASPSAQETRFPKLQAVETYLEKNGLIQEYVEANKWIRFTGPLRMATFDAAPDLVGFFGQIEDMHIFLGGSTNHLIAQSGPKTVRPPLSSFPYMVREFDKILKQDKQVGDESDINRAWKKSGISDAPGLPGLISRLTGKFSQDYLRESAVLPLALTTVARVFEVQEVHGERPRKRAVIGSPLYVADA